MVPVNKSEFCQLNDERYVLPDGIYSLPFRHKDLEEIPKFKENLNTTPQDLIKNNEKELLPYEQKFLKKMNE